MSTHMISSHDIFTPAVDKIREMVAILDILHKDRLGARGDHAGFQKQNSKRSKRKASSKPAQGALWRPVLYICPTNDGIKTALRHAKSLSLVGPDHLIHVTIGRSGPVDHRSLCRSLADRDTLTSGLVTDTVSSGPPSRRPFLLYRFPLAIWAIRARSNLFGLSLRCSLAVVSYLR